MPTMLLTTGVCGHCRWSPVSRTFVPRWPARHVVTRQAMLQRSTAA
jgi:hypothetical protein